MKGDDFFILNRQKLQNGFNLTGENSLKKIICRRKIQFFLKDLIF
jgi:hypothetical protein